MKRIIYIISALLSVSVTATGSELIAKGDSAYAAEQYTEAMSIYNKAIESEGTSSDLWYNIGNAYYRNGDIAKAIISYERALRMDPTNTEAQTNLEFVNSKIVDKKGESGSFFSNTLHSIALNAHSNTWAWTAMLFFVLTIIAAVLYFFIGNVLLRKVGFFGGIVTLIVTIICVILSIVARKLAIADNEAIVSVESTILSTSPRIPKSRSEESMLLHEGTKLTILDSLSSPTDTTGMKWYDVQVDNGHRAWIKSTDIEII